VEEKKNVNEDAFALLSIRISNKKNKDAITSVALNVDDNELRVNEDYRLFFNGEQMDFNIDSGESSSRYRERYIEFIDEKDSMLYVLSKAFRSEKIIESVIQKIFENYIEKKDFYSTELVDVVRREYVAHLSAEMGTNNNFNLEEFNKSIRIMSNRDAEMMKIITIKQNVLEKNENKNYLSVIYMNEIGMYCANFIQSYFMRVCYIKPVRAHADRYYRLTNLSVNDIDSDGKNLPLFIQSLSEQNLEKYNKWIDEYFNFRVVPRLTDGHVSLYIEKNNSEINISDTGYGYSQLLPIVTQLWLILNTNAYLKNESPTVFAIEQPELHLHPELQAKLMDLITKIAKNKKGKIQFLLETHSEVMINRIGNLIYKNKISQDDVNIILFEKDNQGFNTEVRVSKFNKDGYLENWPIGFFSVDEIE